MVTKTFVIAALALGAIAAPTGSADASKPFKIGVKFDNKTLYVTNTTTASEKKEDGVTCTIGDKGDLKGVITCNNNLGLYFTEGHPFDGLLVPKTLEGAKEFEQKNPLMNGLYLKSNQNWSIGANNTISWKTQWTGLSPTNPNTVHFSKIDLSKVVGKALGETLETALGSANQLYAEVCSTYGHPDGQLFTVGEARADFV